MESEIDIKYMARAIELARKGVGHVNPNPPVGAVIVKNGKIIGEGYHQAYGGPHAEINAINHASGDISGSTLYVTLEPCNHHGKTPPCTERIISENIKQVVIGIRDPNKRVAGGGIEKLESAGIVVKQDILRDEVSTLNEFFIKYSETGLPFCTLKTAMSLDGKLATYTGDSKWITDDTSRQLVHTFRHTFAAILTGVNTIINDNPLLNDRSGITPESHPIKIIVDSTGRTPLNSALLNDTARKTILAVTEKAPHLFRDAITKLGGEIVVCPEIEGRVDLTFLMRHLGNAGIDSVMIEAGGALNFSALQQGIVDKVLAFIAPKFLGGANAKTAVDGNGFVSVVEAKELIFKKVRLLNNDLLIEAYIKRNDMFTGIVEEIGKIIAVRWGSKSATLTIKANKVLSDVKIGDSINTNGACLTVTGFNKNSFITDVMSETMKKTNLHLLKTGSEVNLERAMQAGDRFGGHMVSGHIDDTGEIVSLKKDEIATWVSIRAKQDIIRYIVYKGSVAIDGISLTVAKVDHDIFEVSIIPHTSQETTLLNKKPGDLVNIECDVIAKYIEKFTGSNKQKEKKSGIDLNFLSETGYID